MVMERQKTVKRKGGPLYLLQGVFSMGINLVMKILPVYLTNFTSSATEIASVNFSYNFSRILSSIPSGSIGDRLGAPKTLLWSLIILSILPLGLFVSDSILAFSFFFFLIGISTTLYYLSVNSLAISVGRRPGEGISRLESAYQIGFIIGPIIGGFIAYSLNMRIVFVLWSALTFVGTLIAYSLFKMRTSRIQQSEPHSKRNPLSETLRVIKLYPLTFVMFFVIGGSLIGILEGARDLLVPLYANQKGIDIAGVGAIFAISALITAILIVPLGKFSDKYGRGWGLLVGYAIVSLPFLMLPWTGSLLTIALLTGILSTGRTTSLVNTRALCGDMIEERYRVTGLAFFEIAFLIGRATGVLLSGLMIDLIGAVSGFYVFGGTALFVLIIVQVYLVYSRKKMSSESRT